MQVNDALLNKIMRIGCRRWRISYSQKNKIGFIDGSIEKPEKTSKDYMSWMRVDAMIKGWLTTAMEKEIRGSVKYANTTADMWFDLRERFGKRAHRGRTN